MNLKLPALPLPIGRATASLLGRKWFRWVGYPAYFVFCLTAFGYFTFPYERVRERVRAEMESTLNADVEIADLSPSWVTGVELTGVQIKTRPSRVGEKGSSFVVDSLTARASLLGLVTGGLDLGFAAELLGGELEGEAEQDGEGSHVVLDWSDLDLGQVAMVRDAIGLPVKGVLAGHADLRMPGSQLAASEGAISLSGEDVEVGDDTSKLALPGMPGDGITVDRIRVGQVRAELRVKAGVAEIERMTSTSADLEMVWEGNMRLRDPFPQSTVSSYMRFKFGDSYKTRSDRTKALFEMLDLVPRMRQAKRPDGFFGYRVSGSFDRGLTFTPTARGGGRNTRDTSGRPERSRRSRSSEGAGDDTPVDDLLGPPNAP